MKSAISNYHSLTLGFAVLVLTGISACASVGAPLRASMEPMNIEQTPFQRDASGGITEADLQRVIEAPVFLETDQRLGVIPVSTCYQPDPDIPLALVPHELSRAMESSGLFKVSTEVSTDWPADRGLGGLRELAARYRSRYLLLYRHRFVDRTYTNGWGWFYLTVVGILVAPATSLETAGVLEATLFDVKTGTLLFTTFERVHKVQDETVWHNERKRRAIKAKLLQQAADRLSAQVVAKSRRLVAARVADSR